MDVKHYEGNGRLSLVTECNGILHLTGRTCMPAGPGVKEQTAGVLKILEETLEKYGSDKEHIIFAQEFLKDVIRDFDEMNEKWQSWIVTSCEQALATIKSKIAK